MGVIVRKQDWPERLGDFIEQRRDTPFVWGKSDCCLFAADGVEVITGIDFAEKWRGKYSSALGAMRFVRQDGGIDKLVSLESLPALMAQRGDVVMVGTQGDYALGVCLGRSLAAQGPDGVQFLPADRALLAWKVGR